MKGYDLTTKYLVILQIGSILVYSYKLVVNSPFICYKVTELNFDIKKNNCITP